MVAYLDMTFMRLQSCIGHTSLVEEVDRKELTARKCCQLLLYHNRNSNRCPQEPADLDTSALACLE